MTSSSSAPLKAVAEVPASVSSSGASSVVLSSFFADGLAAFLVAAFFFSLSARNPVTVEACKAYTLA